MDWPAALAALERGTPVYRDAWPVHYVDAEFGPHDEGYPHQTASGIGYQLLLCSYGERAAQPYVPSEHDAAATDWREA